MKARDSSPGNLSEDSGYGIDFSHAPCSVSPDEQPIICAALLAARVLAVSSRPDFPATS